MIKVAPRVLYMWDAHLVKFKAGLGSGTNNIAELMAVKLPLMFESKKGAHVLQIFGDSLVLIKWTNEVNDLTTTISGPYMRRYNLIGLHLMFFLKWCVQKKEHGCWWLIKSWAMGIHHRPMHSSILNQKNLPFLNTEIILSAFVIYNISAGCADKIEKTPIRCYCICCCKL